MKNELWDRVEKTDPARTTPFKRGGGFTGTAINATYLLKRLTEEFGPCGHGWKFVIENEDIVEGHTLKSGDRTKVHIIRGHIDYLMNGQWYSTSPQYGQTMLVDENKYGPYTDEEAPKKSVTDCISKCAVQLGFCADVHLGLFDDNKYVNDRKAEVAKANGTPKAVEPTAKTAAKAYTDNAIKEIATISTQEEIDDWEKQNTNHLIRLKKADEGLHKEIMEVLADQYEKLTERTDAA